MKKLITLFTLGMFTLVNISFAQNEIIIHSDQNNRFASALYESVNGCLVTDVLVQTGTLIVHSNGGGQPFNSPFTYILIQQADLCLQQYTYYATNTVYQTGGVDANLISASTDVDIPLTDLISGGNFVANVSLNWTSTGGMITGQFSNTVTNLKGLHITTINHGVYRMANPVGSVTLDGGDNLIDPSNLQLAYILKGGGDEIINENLNPHRDANPNTIQSANAVSDVTLYPNPALDVLHLNVSNASHLSVVNVLGSVVADQNIMEGTTDLDISNYAPGIYFIRMQNDQGEIMKKFTKQ